MKLQQLKYLIAIVDNGLNGRFDQPGSTPGWPLPLAHDRRESWICRGLLLRPRGWGHASATRAGLRGFRDALADAECVPRNSEPPDDVGLTGRPDVVLESV